jgi:nicotinamide mononucleotide (NMN) deamidase PncC
LLDRNRTTVATAEWGSGGLIAQWLEDVPVTGHGRYRGGFVIHSPDALGGMLGIRRAPGEGTDGHEVVAAMAEACRERSGADFGLATGPRSSPASDEAPAGPSYVALATVEGVSMETISCAGHPSIVKARIAKQALNALRLLLMERASP